MLPCRQVLADAGMAVARRGHACAQRLAARTDVHQRAMPRQPVGLLLRGAGQLRAPGQRNGQLQGRVAAAAQTPCARRIHLLQNGRWRHAVAGVLRLQRRGPQGRTGQQQPGQRSAGARARGGGGRHGVCRFCMSYAPGRAVHGQK